MSVINQISLKDSGGESSTTYDIGADATYVMYDSAHGINIKTKIDSKADAQSVSQSIQQINNVIPSSATSSNKLATSNDLSTGLSNKADTSTVTAIQNVIPSAATSSNQLSTASDLSTGLSGKLDKTGGTITNELTINNGLILGNGNKLSKVTFSTTDLTPGTSTLTIGELYFVYEV